MLLTLLVQYRKYESTNPYIVNLSILDSDIALNVSLVTYYFVVCDAICDVGKSYFSQRVYLCLSLLLQHVSHHAILNLTVCNLICHSVLPYTSQSHMSQYVVYVIVYDHSHYSVTCHVSQSHMTRCLIVYITVSHDTVLSLTCPSAWPYMSQHAVTACCHTVLSHCLCSFLYDVIIPLFSGSVSDSGTVTARLQQVTSPSLAWQMGRR